MFKRRDRFFSYSGIKYHITFQMRVGHFEPEEITLSGEGVFPRITLDLPRDTENDHFKELFETAKHNLANVEKMEEDESDVFLRDSEVN